jgi:hypothetical protein
MVGEAKFLCDIGDSAKKIFLVSYVEKKEF